MKWTTDQQKAIDARNGTLLVSAAAGSGKTAVLVERVIRRICDSENPCGVENLLIVTFTKAAAAQMKEKIEAAISKYIPKDEWSSLLYASRIAQYLEKDQLYAQNRSESQWEKEAKRMAAATSEFTVRTRTNHRQGRLAIRG